MIVIVRGQHGMRGSPDLPESWIEGDFVTAFHRQTPTLVYDSSRGGEGTGEDALQKADVYRQPIDPLRGAPEVGAPSSEVDLTEPFRSALGEDGVDFLRPVQEEPIAGRIALRSDAYTPSLPGTNPVEVQATAELVLLDPRAVPGPEALVPVPGSELTLHETLRRAWEVSWSRDGEALFFRRGLTQATVELARWAPGAPQPEAFVEPLARTSTFPLDDLQAREVGDLIDTCSGAEQIDALSDARVAVVASCARYRVVIGVSGQKALQIEDAGHSLQLMDVVVSTDEPGLLDGVYSHRFVVHPSSGTGSVVACGPTQTCYLHDPSSAFSPRWDPEGERIAFLYRPEGSVVLEQAKRLLVADLETGAIRTLVALAAEDPRTIGSPEWSPGGDWLAFLMIDPTDGSRDLYVVRSDQPGPQEPRRVTRGADVGGALYWSDSGVVLPAQ